MNLDALMQRETATLGELYALNQALRKAADIGYQTGAGTSGGTAGGLSPLVAQSIEPMLSSATFDMTEIVLWNKIPKGSATQTLHEYNKVTQRGLDVDMFVAEGSAGANNKSTYERKSVKIKFGLERREVTDVATMVGLMGPNAQALALETEQGTQSLVQKVESSLWHASEAINPLAYDGIFKQMDDWVNPDGSKNVTDLDGEPASFELLKDTLARLGAAPLFGYPDTIYVEPRVFGDLDKQAFPAGRFGLDVTGRQLTYGASELFVQGPRGKVPIISAPFLFEQNAAPTAASASDAPATPAFDAGNFADNGAGTSRFKAGDAGDYKWKVVAVGKKGYSAPLTSAAVGVIAGSKIKATLAAAPAGVSYYRVYRSDKAAAGAADAGTAKYLFSVAAVEGVATVITDLNAVKPNTSKAFFAAHRNDIFEYVRLLDLIRRPLAEVETTKPFALMLFGSPVVKVPSKCWAMKNIGLTA